MTLQKIESLSPPREKNRHLRQLVLSSSDWGRDLPRLIIAAREDADIATASEDEVQTNKELFPAIGQVSSSGKIDIFTRQLMEIGLYPHISEFIEDLIVLLEHNGHTDQDKLKSMVENIHFA
jgi:hypothetical protein